MSQSQIPSDENGRPKNKLRTNNGNTHRNHFTLLRMWISPSCHSRILRTQIPNPSNATQIEAERAIYENRYTTTPILGQYLCSNSRLSVAIFVCSRVCPTRRNPMERRERVGYRRSRLAFRSDGKFLRPPTRTCERSGAGRGVESKSTFCWHTHPVPDECFGDLDRPRSYLVKSCYAAHAGHGCKRNRPLRLNP